MKGKDRKDLHEKNTEELKVLLQEAYRELAKLRLESATKKLKNLRQIFFQRKKIARMLTIARGKEKTHG